MNHLSGKKFISISLLILTSMGFAAAQSTLDQDSIWKSLELDDLIVTAQYAPTHYKNAVHNVKVITAAEIEKQGQYNLSEVLSNQMNLRINVDPILGNGLRIQGIGGENIQIMIDGVPVIGRTDGNIDLSQILLHNIERIEIVEGALSAQYGSNASGGVINLISRKNQIEKVFVESQNLVESVGILNNSLGVGFRQNKFSGRIHGSRVNYSFAPVDSLRIIETVVSPEGGMTNRRKIPWNPKIQHGISGNLNFSPSDSLKFVYQYGWFDEEVNRYGDIKRPVFKPYAFDETYTTFRQDHSLLTEWYPNEGSFVSSTTAFNVFERLKGVNRLDFEDGKITELPAEQDTARFTSFLHRTVLSSLGGRLLNVQVGAEVFLEAGSGARLQDTASQESLTNLNNYALWLGLQYEPFRKFKLLGNVRYGYNSQYNHPVVPSLNAHWQVDRNLNLRLGYAYGFRAPSLKELYFNFIDVNHFITGNPNLEAEYSHNASFSVDYDWVLSPGNTISFQGKTFYNKINNRIILALLEGLQYTYQNIESFETHGVNLGVSGNWGKKVDLSSSLGIIRLYNQFNEMSDSPKFTTSQEWRNSISFEIPWIETNMMFTHNFFGRQILFFQAAEGVSEGFIDAYHIANLTFSRDFFKDRIFLSAGVKNIFDVENVPFAGIAGGVHGGSGDSRLVGWGRSWFLGVNVRVGR